MAGKKKADTSNYIVVRRRRKNHTDHLPHGSWKIAYADFVTAMMAFFLLMWLVNITTEEDKKRISDYFNPYSSESASQDIEVISGIIAISDGGKLSGENITDREIQDAQGDPETNNPEPIEEIKPNQENLFIDLSTIELDREVYEELLYKSQKLDELQNDLDNLKDFQFESPETLEPLPIDEEILEIWKNLSKSLKDLPELKNLSENLIIEQIPEGLKIQIVDKNDFSMFELGSSSLTMEARKLLETVGGVLKDIENPIAVSGHTDGRPFTSNRNYSNWELSSERANSARRELIKNGLTEKQFARVEGRADTDHLIEEDPLDPRNRRISILVLRYYD